MPSTELTREGARAMAVCNACRYCEQYCPVFPAMEQRRVFTAADLNYLANLCHNCGECLYACQYAAPHEFMINIPRTLAKVRVQSYAEYAWPRPLAAAFRRSNLATGVGLFVLLMAVMLAAAFAGNGGVMRDAGNAADFYSVVPHDVMVGLFGGVGLFVLIALAIGVRRCWRDLGRPRGSVAAMRDVLTLRNLHATGPDCVTAEEVRMPLRRWFHHATFYGFGLCFASTTVAAIYHTFFGWPAPYGYSSLPVLLGAAGGFGLIVGPAGLWSVRAQRDPMLTDPSQEGLDRGFLALLLLTSATGLLLLVLREQSFMGLLLIVHLAAVLALFLTLPYGKFVHGFYRTLALMKSAAEADRPVID